MRSLAFLVVAGACAKVGEVPTFDTKITVVDDPTLGVSVTGPGFRMEFAPQDLQLPTAFVIDGVDVLQKTECTERLIGVAVFPVAGANGLEPGTGTHVIELAGPAIARVVVDFQRPYACQGPQKIIGKSTFTFLPTKRIERRDDFTLATAQIDDNAGCECAVGGEAFRPNSFWAFDSIRDRRFDDPNVEPVESFACFSNATATLGVNYVGGARKAGSGTLGAWIHDVDNPGLTLPPLKDYTAISTFFTVSGRLTGDEIEAGIQCRSALAATMNDPPLNIDGIPNVAAGGIYNDSVTHPDAVELTVDASMTHGFAVTLDLAGATHAVVTKNGVAEPFTPQAVPRADGGQSVLFWFDAPLLAGETLTITPES